ncbi:MAG: hypothetical protein ACXWLX_07220, partial [Rhizomicrobium sp.]
DILSLEAAAKIRHVIPSTFDGSNPVLTFSNENIARLKIGNWYDVPGPGGLNVNAQLCDGIVVEDKKIAYCIYRTADGIFVHYSNTLTDDEVSAYKLHPETFFGVVKKNGTRSADGPVEFFDFLFESYQRTSKEKLLEFLASAPDYETLKEMSQRDLAIAYCERITLQVFGNKISKAPI